MFARKKFGKYQILPGLVEILAPAVGCSADRAENQFFVYRTSSGNHLMLGPLSFNNSSCRPSQLVKKLG